MAHHEHPRVNTLLKCSYHPCALLESRELLRLGLFRPMYLLCLYLHPNSHSEQFVLQMVYSVVLSQSDALRRGLPMQAH